MALDTALRRGSAVNVGLPWRTFLPSPDGTIATEDRYAVGFMYSGLISTPPVQLESVPNFSARFDSGTHELDLSVYFSGATSYAIDPAVETGWSLDTGTGVLTIDTDDADTFGPYTVTASNGGGDADSNPFTVKVSASAGTAFSQLIPSSFRIGF
jgi:hypothetical protein